MNEFWIGFSEFFNSQTCGMFVAFLIALAILFFFVYMMAIFMIKVKKYYRGDSHD